MKGSIPTTRFPNDDRFQIGTVVEARYIRHRGDRESDADFGPWKDYRVQYVQRDKRGQICCIGFEGLGVEFDPRHQTEQTQPNVVLMAEDHELQISQSTMTESC